MNVKGEDWFEPILHTRTPLSPNLTPGFLFALFNSVVKKLFLGRKNIGGPPPPFPSSTVTPMYANMQLLLKALLMHLFVYQIIAATDTVFGRAFLKHYYLPVYTDIILMVKIKY